MEAIKPEIKRLAYLKALGIESWYAPTPLPGALPSPELDWMMYSGEALPEVIADETNTESVSDFSQTDSVSLDEGAEVSFDAAKLDATTSSSSRENLSNQQRDIPQPDVKPEAVSSNSTPLVFTLHVTHIEGKGVILADLQDPEAPGFSSEEFHLMDALLFALGWDQAKSINTLFKWPYTPNKNIPQGTVEANQAISAYLRNLIGDSDSRLVLLGQHAMEVVSGKFGEFEAVIKASNEEFSDAERNLVSYSLNEFINKPSLKKHLWQRLSCLMS